MDADGRRWTQISNDSIIFRPARPVMGFFEISTVSSAFIGVHPRWN
jgi:hypothetical protein